MAGEQEMPRLYFRLMAVALVGAVIGVPLVPARAAPPVQLAAGPSNDKGSHDPGAAKGDAGEEKELTPEQKMQKRFPHPVRVGDLLGLAVLDDNDSTIGYVRDVVRSPEGKIFLIVPYSAWFGWAPVNWGKRPVAVPIEVVAILARQLDALDMSRDDFNEAETWMPAQGKSIPFEEKTLIALGRR
jgi:hypothetical protein